MGRKPSFAVIRLNDQLGAVFCMSADGASLRLQPFPISAHQCRLPTQITTFSSGNLTAWLRRNLPLAFA